MGNIGLFYWNGSLNVLNVSDSSNEEQAQSDVNNSNSVNAIELSQSLQTLMTRLVGQFMSEDGSRVDYESLRSSSLFKEYLELSKLLQNIQIEDFDETERKVFFINIYNALTIHGLSACKELPSSPWRVSAFWKKTAYRIGSFTFSLDDIEHGVLRANKGHPLSLFSKFSANDPRRSLCLSKVDPRIHFALNCGAKSCPPIRVYNKNNVEYALEAAARGFCHQEVRLEYKKLKLSMIFRWYFGDFAASKQDFIQWLLPYVDGETKQRVDAILATGSYPALDYVKYDWSLNKV